MPEILTHEITTPKPRFKPVIEWGSRFLMAHQHN